MSHILQTRRTVDRGRRLLTVNNWKMFRLATRSWIIYLISFTLNRPDVQLIEEDAYRPSTTDVELEDVQIGNPKLEQLLKDGAWVDDATYVSEHLIGWFNWLLKLTVNDISVLWHLDVYIY